MVEFPLFCMTCTCEHHLVFNIFYVGYEDYEPQDYRSVATFVTSGKTFVELTIKPINNDTVECDKTYCLEIYSDLLPKRVTAISPDDTKITIRDDDSKYIL